MPNPIMNKNRGFTYTHFQKAVFSSKKTVFKTPYFGGFCPLGHFFATFLVAPREAKKCELFSEWPKAKSARSRSANGPMQ